MIEELIQEGQYNQALNLLTDTSDEKTRYLRLICLVGLEEYQQAKREGMVAKVQATDTYYDVVSMYVTTLKELGEYEEAINILIEELSMPYIPYQYETIFNTAYDQILLDKQDAMYDVENKNQIFSIEEIDIILKKEDCNEDLLYMALDQLQQLNIRMIIPTVRDYLRNPHHHYFVKSLLLEIMIEQQVDEEFEVEKFDQIYYFNPSFMPLVLQQECYEGILKYLQDGLESDNPTLLEQCNEYLEYYLYAIYPKEVYEEDYALKAATIHYYLATMQGIDTDLEEIEFTYNVSKESVQSEILALKQIEC